MHPMYQTSTEAELLLELWGTFIRLMPLPSATCSIKNKLAKQMTHLEFKHPCSEGASRNMGEFGFFVQYFPK